MPHSSSASSIKQHVPLLLRHILHALLAAIRNGSGPSPAAPLLLPLADLALILHYDTAATTTRSSHVRACTALDLVRAADARALHAGEQTPQAARERHEGAVRVDGLVAERVRGVAVRRLLAQAVRCPAVQHAGAEDTRHARADVAAREEAM